MKNLPFSLLTAGLSLAVIAFLCFYLPCDGGGFWMPGRTVFHLAIWLCLVLWLLEPHPLPAEARSLALPALAFLFLSGISTIFSAYVHDSLQEWLNLASYVVAFTCAIVLFTRFPVRRLMIILLATSAFAFCLLSLLPGEINFPFTSVTASFFGRFYQANATAAFLLLIIFPALALYLRGGERLPTFFYGLVGWLALLCLGLTNSRGGWLVCLLVLLPVLVGLLRGLSRREGLGLVIRLGILLFCLLLALKLLTDSGPQGGVAPQVLTQRAAELTEATSTSRGARVVFWKAALEIAVEHPVTGTGFGTFGKFLPRHLTDIRFYSKYVHNLYLALAAEAGFPALAAFLWLVGTLLVAVFRKGRILGMEPQSTEWALWVGLSGALVTFLLHNGIDIDWRFPAIPLFWVLEAALLLSLSPGVLKRESEALSSEGGWKTFLTSSPEIAPDRNVFLRARPWLRLLLAFLVLVMMAIRFVPYLAYNLEQAARQSEEKGDLARAITLLDQANRLDRLNAYTRRDLAHLLVLASRHTNDPRLLDAALLRLNQAIALDPARASNYHYRAQIHLDRRRLEQAAGDIQKAIALDPATDPGFYNTWGRIAELNRDFPSAEAAYMKALGMYTTAMEHDIMVFRRQAIGQRKAEALVGLADLHGLMGKFTDAEKELAQARELDPENPKIEIITAINAMRARNWSLAETHLRAVLAKEEGFPLGNLLLGWCLENQGRDREAKVYLRRAAELNPAFSNLPPPQHWEGLKLE